MESFRFPTDPASEAKLRQRVKHTMQTTAFRPPPVPAALRFYHRLEYRLLAREFSGQWTPLPLLSGVGRRLLRFLKSIGAGGR